MAYNCASSQKTRSAIGALKAEWKRDGGEWDLEDAPGWEAHRDELRAFREETEAAWKAEAKREREAALDKLIAPALAYLPEKDELGGLTRAEASRPEHAAHRLLRAVAAMLLPVVERLDRLDEQVAEVAEITANELDDVRESIGAA